MNINERMEQLRQEMEQRRREMEERMSQMQSTLNGSKKPSLNVPQQTESVNRSTPLLHHEGLEDESETKLGMFERLYSGSYPHHRARTFQSFGYSDLDFSPYTNLLAGIGEIELYESLKFIVRDLCDTTIEKKKSTYGDFLYLLENKQFKEFLGKIIGDTDLFKKQLEAIRRIRNSANHKGIVTEAIFNKFFEKEYVPFFNETLKALIAIKGKRAEDFEGYQEARTFDDKAQSGDSINPISGKGMEAYNSSLSTRGDKSSEPDKDTKTCVILTDTNQLALKYNSEIALRTNHGGIFNFGAKIRLQLDLTLINLQKVADTNDERIKYLIIDIAEPEWCKLIGDDKTWLSYLRVLEAYREGLADGSGIDSPSYLYILGGDDVIPMPRLRNPIDDEFKRANNIDTLEATIEADWLYSFSMGSVKVDGRGYLDFEGLTNERAVFYVSRLPLESGLMESSFEDDVLGYLNRTLKHHLENGKITKVGAVTSEVCRKVMDLTIQGFPRCDLDGFGKAYQYKGAFLSPDISLDNPSVKDEQILSAYVDKIRSCQMVTFDLHGTPHPKYRAFAGEAANHQKTQAFIPEFLSHSEIKVIVPICCWGAKYIGYRRDNSTLLYSFYKADNLLFMGSCRTAYGSVDSTDEKEETRLLYGSWLMRLFMQYILAGYRGAEALHRAKVMFLKNHCDRSPFSLLTVLEFNLFGDPTLRFEPTVPIDDIVRISQSSSLILPDFSDFDSRYSEETIYEEQDEKTLLSRVRNLVDKNLNDVRERMNKVLYQHYNIRPENLRKITKYTTGRGTKGLRFVYSDDGPYPSTIYALSDEKGNLNKVVHMK
ncbi:MAG: hypothetical protein NC039_05355 [Muribaculaceae bacterium]|nr:hypothetical protein [Muribaculaceae bacterium]